MAVALLSVSAGAQDTAVVRACDRPSTGRVRAAFYGRLEAIPKNDTGSRVDGYLRDVLEAVRQSLHPGPLGLAVYNLWPGHATLTGEATVIFSVTRQGAVRDLALAASSLAPALDRAVYEAVKRADSAQLIPPLPARGPSHAKFFLTVYIAPYPDTAAAHPGRSALVAPLLTTMLPSWETEVTLADTTKGEQPQWPQTAVLARVGDSLFVRFVVDERGDVVRSSVFFESAQYLDFAKSLYRWLPHAKYKPARIGDCAVKSLEHETFLYRFPTN